MISPSPASSDLVEHISAHSGSLPSARRFAPSLTYSADAPAVDAPRHVVLVLAGGDAGVALDATVGVAEKFHSSHGSASLRRPDLAKSRLGFLHAGDRIVAVGRERIRALAQHDRIGTFR